MKKRLEADLVSIAHRILQLKNKSDINQLYLETQKLYEKLSVLRFIEEHYGNIKPTIGHAEMEKEIENFYDKSAELPVETVIEMTESNVFPEASEEEPAAVENVEDEKIEAAIPEKKAKVEKTESPEFSMEEMEEDIEEETAMAEAFEADIKELQIEPEKSPEENDLPEEDSNENTPSNKTVKDIIPEEETPPPFKAAFELTEDTETEIPKQAETVQISFADLLGSNYSEPHFVKVDDVEASQEIPKTEKAPINIEKKKPEMAQTKNVSLNDKLSKGIDIDLNDRIAFVKHLFGNSAEDYNRVLNQLITFDNFYETKSFIEEMVKPDYNYWKGKDEYAERFMEIIEKKFL